LVNFGSVFFVRYASAQTDRHADHNTSHPCRGEVINYTKYISYPEGYSYTRWPSVCPSVGILAVTHQGVPGAACDSASVHFGPTIRRTDILVQRGTLGVYRHVTVNPDKIVSFCLDYLLLDHRRRNVRWPRRMLSMSYSYKGV